MWTLYDTLIQNIEPSRTVELVALGSFRAAVKSGGVLGISTLLHTENEEEKSQIIPKYNGMPLFELASLAKSFDPLESAIGVAAINAYYNDPAILSNHAQNEGEDAFSLFLPKAKGKKVAMIGRFLGIKELYQPICDFSVFERNPTPDEYPDTAEEYLLPEMDFVFATGMALTNKTLPRLLTLSNKADFILTGPSAPLTSLLFSFGITAISGMIVTDAEACLSMLLQNRSKSFMQYTKKITLHNR